MIKLLVLTLLFFASETNSQQVYNKLNVKELDVTSRVNVTSTTKSSKPCPAMTETQRNAIATPLNGSCIYNTTTLKLNVYNGTVWKAAGGGVDNWLTATAYSVDDIVIESSKIYQCLIAHTSGTFATDLAASRWVEISATVPVNLTGPITSVGNATSIASQTGIGTKFVVDNTPTLITPNIGAATGTSLTLAGNISAYNYDKDNLLVNGNVENPLSTEWTCTVGTCTRTTTAGQFSKDTAALSVALSAQAMNVSQTVTTPSGIQKQGFARVIYRVPATMADFQVCTLVDASEQTCVPTNNLIKDDTFRSIEIPLTFGATSAGIKFKTTSAYSASAYFDGAILAQGLGTQNLMLDNVYSAQVSTTGVVTFESKEWITGNCTVGGTSEYTCNISSLALTAAPNCAISVIQDSGVAAARTGTSATSLVYRTTDDGGGLSVRSVNIVCQKSGNDYLASSSNVYSQASANFSQRSDGVITITAVSGGLVKGTTTTDRWISSRFGNRLIADGQYVQSVAGTAGTGDYLYTLPGGLSFDSTSITPYSGAAWSAAGQALALAFVGTGSMNNSTASGTNCGAYAYSSTQFRLFCNYSNSQNGATASGIIGSAFFPTSGLSISYYMHIDAPISGWSNSNVIVGSFEGIEKCVGNECDDTFSAKVSGSGVVSDENTDWIQGSCTVASPSVCTFKSGVFTVAPNCAITPGSIRDVYVTTTSTTASIQQSVSSSGATEALSNPFQLVCQKQGVDYKPKTAKVASSIGVPTVPGISTQAIDTFSVSYGTTNATTVCSASPCSYLDQIGTAVTSITRSAVGNYTVNLGKTYTKLKGIPNAASVGAGSVRVPEIIQCSNCSSVSFKTLGNTGSDGDSSGTIFFQGTY